MNMLPINAEWKRRIKWAEQQKKQQLAGKLMDKQKDKKQTLDSEAEIFHTGSGRK
ncbi:hypothetical protein SOV_34900 [Sporomusa ovata DSM 2662]|uniref:Uncharacterized protein n=2 Tax=Sporomusa ovata TaxID=2378 RepID=A0A0U1L773_9FIRM|nr:hypothetical protein [Sporomusa ovata]EQB24638.1 hypothetical protein SOV_6c00520 [Sporomusa ovata DSM 2662]CQR74983.1 hypothetical protein SpAn4DRAFT_4347 [Sporomusa ovata]